MGKSMDGWRRTKSIRLPPNGGRIRTVECGLESAVEDADGQCWVSGRPKKASNILHGLGAAQKSALPIHVAGGDAKMAAASPDGRICVAAGDQKSKPTA